jgi:hypothetical protein
MSMDLLAALYVWCANHHEGQWSREYRIMSRIAKRGLRLTDSAWEAIQDGTGRAAEEWAYSRTIYETLCSRH